MPEEEGPSKAEQARMVSPGMLLGLMAFVAILGFVSVYLAEKLVAAEVELAKLEERELSGLAMLYVKLATWAYAGPAIMIVVVVVISNGGTRHQRIALALIAIGLAFSMLWHIGARSVF